jgi:hypothetical protein
VCEGSKTEPAYFHELRRAERRQVELEIVPAGTPKTVVERAVEMQKEAIRKARKDPFLGYDQVWCVFDIDEHPLVPDAIQQARDHKIELAISNPCFELWALLHFQDHQAHIERDRLRDICQRHMPRYGKIIPFSDLFAHIDTAINRAEELDRIHERRDTPGGNPSTGVYRLVRSIRSNWRVD